MCIRTYVAEHCTRCKVPIDTSCSVEACWWETLSRGRCQNETMTFKKIIVIGCSECRMNEDRYPTNEMYPDQKLESWADDDPDKPPNPKPKYYWKNSMPEEYVRRKMGDKEYEEWKAQEWKEEEERKEAKRIEEEERKERRWNGGPETLDSDAEEERKKSERWCNIVPHGFHDDEFASDPPYVFLSRARVKKVNLAQDITARNGTPRRFKRPRLPDSSVEDMDGGVGLGSHQM